MSGSATRSSSGWEAEIAAQERLAGGRGGGWVAGQFALMALLAAAGFLPPSWPAGAQRALSIAGAALAIAGVGFAVWAGRTLGRALTPFPKPVPVGLVTSGPFAIVRHPIYAGGLGLCVGYALWSSIPAFVLSVALAFLWAAKLRIEERFLDEVYDGYPAYRARVRRRLIPFVY